MGRGPLLRGDGLGLVVRDLRRERFELLLGGRTEVDPDPVAHGDALGEIAREALAKFRAPVWSGQITNRADLLMALGQGEGAREYYAEGRAAAEINRLWAAIERSIKAIRGTASASGAMHKQAA